MTKEQVFSKEYAKELLSIAHQDLASAKALAKANGLRVENVFLLAQQGLEKALKAVLCWNSKPVPFVHEIGILVAKLENIGRSPPFGYDLNSLSEFATIRRYLEGREAFTDSEVQALLAQVEGAIEWCSQQIKSTTRP